jgi:hypothetical protein
MSGYRLIQKIRDLEEKCDRLGFVIAHSQYTGWSSNVDYIALNPKGDQALPLFSRDAELYVGTIEGLEEFLKGIEWARNYDRMLFGKLHTAKRERKEQDVRNKQLLDLIKTGEKP